MSTPAKYFSIFWCYNANYSDMPLIVEAKSAQDAVDLHMYSKQAAVTFIVHGLNGEYGYWQGPGRDLVFYSPNAGTEILSTDFREGGSNA